MNLFHQSMTKALVGFGLVSAMMACSSSGVVDPDTLVFRAIQQTSPIEAGKTVVLPNREKSAISVITNSNPEVATVQVTDKGLEVRALQYGMTTISLKGEGGKSQSVPLWITGERPVLPTERFAQFNVAPDGASFAKTQDPQASGYFTFKQASNIRITADGKTYRVPTKEELHALLPYEEEISYYGREAKKFSFIQSVTLDGVSLIYGESFYSPGRNVAYALRFGKSNGQGANHSMDNSKLTAFRYEYSPNREDPKQGYSLKITARYLGETFKHDINFIASEGFWRSYSWDDQTLELPAAGVRMSNGEPSTVGVIGEYWGSTSGADDLSGTALGFGYSTASSTVHADKSIQRPVRLIQAL